jgi:hypothetical protein
MEVMHERVAGLDIGKASLTVCVRTPGPRGRRSETRTYPTTTRALAVMRDWLLERGVTIAAMESTSTYWKPAFYSLEEVLEVWLCNAAHIKAVQRPKTDVKDSERPGARRLLRPPAPADGRLTGRHGCSSGCSWPCSRSFVAVRGRISSLVTWHTERRRTATYAIMTAWQCGGQGFESPQLHPYEQGYLRRALSRRLPWLQFACPYLSAVGRPRGPRPPVQGRA